MYMANSNGLVQLQHTPTREQSIQDQAYWNAMKLLPESPTTVQYSLGCTRVVVNSDIAPTVNRKQPLKLGTADSARKLELIHQPHK